MLPDGYVDGYGPQWRTHSKSLNCCAELHDRSRQLIGEPIFVDSSPDAYIRVALMPGRARPNENLSFFAVNQLTETTAFGLLHLLSHLRHSAFRNIRSRTIHLLNRRILDLLHTTNKRRWGPTGPTTPASDFRLHSRTFEVWCIPTASRLEELSRRVRFKCAYIYMPCTPYGEDRVSSVLQLATGAGRACRKMRININLAHESVDSIVEVGIALLC